MWKILKLSNVCSINNGGTPNSKNKSYWGNEIKWLTPKDMGKLTSRFVLKTERQITQEGLAQSSAKLVPEKSVILSCRAPIGHLAINEVAMSFNQGCKGLIPNEKITTEFLYYFLLSSKKLLNDLGKGTTFKEISAKTLSNVTISIPPLTVQQRIVDKLDATFAEINKAAEITENKYIELNNLLNSYMKRKFNSKEFKSYSLGEVCNFEGGSQPPKSVFEYEKNKHNIRLIQIRDYKSDNHIVYIPKDNARRRCSTTDTMIGRYGPPIFQILRGIEGAYNVALMKAVPKDGILNDYLFYFLKNPKIQNFVIKQSMRAAGQSGVNKDALEPYKIHLPPIGVQKKIIEEAVLFERHVLKTQSVYQRKISNLHRLKSALLEQELQSEAA